MASPRLCFYLLQLLKNVRQGPWDDASVTVALCPARDGECLATARLPICEDGAIVTCQGTARKKWQSFNGLVDTHIGTRYSKSKSNLINTTEICSKDIYRIFM